MATNGRSSDIASKLSPMPESDASAANSMELGRVHRNVNQEVAEPMEVVRLVEDYESAPNLQVRILKVLQ